MKTEDKQNIEKFDTLGKLENCVYPVRSRFRKRKISIIQRIKKAVRKWRN